MSMCEYCHHASIRVCSEARTLIAIAILCLLRAIPFDVRGLNVHTWNNGAGDAAYNNLDYKPVSVMMPVPKKDDNPYWGWFVRARYVPFLLRVITPKQTCARQQQYRRWSETDTIANLCA